MDLVTRGLRTIITHGLYFFNVTNFNGKKSMSRGNTTATTTGNNNKHLIRNSVVAPNTVNSTVDGAISTHDELGSRMHKSETAKLRCFMGCSTTLWMLNFLFTLLTFGFAVSTWLNTRHLHDNGGGGGGGGSSV